MFKTNFFSVVSAIIVLVTGVLFFTKGLHADTIYIIAGIVLFLIGVFALIECIKRRAEDYERDVTKRVMSSRH